MSSRRHEPYGRMPSSPGIAAAGNIARRVLAQAGADRRVELVDRRRHGAAVGRRRPRRRASCDRSNGAYASAPSRIVNVCGFGPVSIERDSISSSTCDSMFAPAAVIRGHQRRRPRRGRGPPRSPSRSTGRPSLPGLTLQSMPPWPVGELSPPALCRCITTTGVSNCSSTARSSAPGASVDASGLSSSLSVPCSPKIGDRGDRRAVHRRRRGSGRGGRPSCCRRAASSFSPRRSWLIWSVGSKLPSNEERRSSRAGARRARPARSLRTCRGSGRRRAGGTRRRRA